MSIITKGSVINDLVRKYLKRITDDCIELSPKIEEAFEIRDEVLKKIIFLTNKERR